MTFKPSKTRLPPLCSRQYDSHRIPSVSAPSMIACDSSALTAITGPRLLSAHQCAAHVGWAEAVLKVDGVADAIEGEVRKEARHEALKHA